jgi:hypothetical protein
MANCNGLTFLCNAALNSANTYSANVIIVFQAGKKQLKRLFGIAFGAFNLFNNGIEQPIFM